MGRLYEAMGVKYWYGCEKATCSASLSRCSG